MANVISDEEEAGKISKKMLKQLGGHLFEELPIKDTDDEETDSLEDICINCGDKLIKSK